MDETLHVIYSASRASTQPTLAYLRLAGVLGRTVIIVPEDQVARYRSAGLGGVEPVPVHLSGTHRAREWAITKTAPSHGASRIVLWDDDLTLYFRPEPTDWHLQYIKTKEQMVGLLTQLDAWLTTGLAHCGISMRGGNNRVQEPYVDCTRSMGVYGYDTATMCDLVSTGDLHLGRCPGQDDFDLTLQMLRLGYPNRVSYVYAQGQKASNSPGGASVWRTPEVLTATANELAFHHPGLVRVREKASRNWQGYPETRTDVTVSWQKAWREGQRRREWARR